MTYPVLHGQPGGLVLVHGDTHHELAARDVVMAFVMFDDLKGTGLVKVERQDTLKVIMEFLERPPPVGQTRRLR